MNVHLIVGNLGADPEVRTTGGGTSVCDLRVATSYRFKNREGDWEDGTDWHSVTVWGGQAEACGKYLTKGSKVAVEGRVTTEKWEDRDGNNRYTTKTIATRVEFLNSKQQDDAPPRRENRQRQEPPRREPVRDESIPF
jgi:single-strand DNA-binding protein